MDSILQVLMSWQFIIFSLGIVAVTSVLRTVVEYLLANVKVIAKESKLWSDLILPILPVILGFTAALVIKGYPYPEGISAAGGRFMFGLVAGLLSTLLYRIVKAFLNQKLTAFLPAGTTPIEDPTADALVKRIGESINKQ